MRFLSALAASSARGTGRFGYPRTGSSTHSTHSGGFSHRSRNSTQGLKLAWLIGRAAAFVRHVLEEHWPELFRRRAARAGVP